MDAFRKSGPYFGEYLRRACEEKLVIFSTGKDQGLRFLMIFSKEGYEGNGVGKSAYVEFDGDVSAMEDVLNLVAQAVQREAEL